MAGPVDLAVAVDASGGLPPGALAVDAVLFDLAGTTIDHGCVAPVHAFVEVFARRGVGVDVATARGPMGTHKREHVERLCADPGVAARWRRARGGPPTAEDVDALVAEAEALQIALMPRACAPIRGLLPLAAALRARGVKLGATTGYTRPIVAALAPLMAAAGWAPEVLVTSDEVPAGRPAPDLNLAAARRLGALDPRRVVAVGDTAFDMQAARAAGMWAVGVALTGNLVALDEDTLAALPAAERAAHRARVGALLGAAGAHAVVDSVAELGRALGALGLARA